LEKLEEERIVDDEMKRKEKEIQEKKRLKELEEKRFRLIEEQKKKDEEDRSEESKEESVMMRESQEKISKKDNKDYRKILYTPIKRSTVALKSNTLENEEVDTSLCCALFAMSGQKKICEPYRPVPSSLK
jgi:hypothetical protein